MPGGDGTGPMGRGPLTGRGMGSCGRGLGRGFGRGYGRCWTEPITLTKEEQKKILEEQKKAIEERLEELK